MKISETIILALCLIALVGGITAAYYWKVNYMDSGDLSNVSDAYEFTGDTTTITSKIGEGISSRININVSGGDVKLSLNDSSQTETLRPNAAGDECTIQNQSGCSACPYHYGCVNQTSSPDGFYIYSENVEDNRDLYNLPQHTGSGTINKVGLWIRFKGDTLGDSFAYFIIKTHGRIYTGAGLSGTSWETSGQVWSKNPHTNKPWTCDELDALQAGVRLKTLAEGEVMRCSQAYVVVSYAPKYNTYGTLTSKAITPAQIVSWGKFYVNDNVSTPGTNITYKILDATDNSTKCTITGSQASSGYDISSCASGLTSIRLFANLTTTNTSNTPTLKDWNVSWVAYVEESILSN